MLNSLDLFSGIGGISYALQDYVCPIAYCEIDEYCRKVLSARFDSDDLARAPIYNDVKELQAKGLDFDIITAGFPCQDISTAGLGKGLDGKRSGLFFEVIRLVEEASPPWVFLENVPAIRTRGLVTVIRAFTDLGYDCRWTCVSAAEVGAPHLRKRWFLLAHSSSKRRQQIPRSSHGYEEKNERWTEEQMHIPKCNGEGDRTGDVADTNGEGLERHNWQKQKNSKSAQYSREDWWQVEPNVGRVVNGIPFRVDRIKALGNSVVPLQCRTAFMRLIGI
jgi:DNA (cytosine-5)-methyltransferase 1